MEREPDDPSPSIPNWVVIEPEICRKDVASYCRHGVTSAKVHASNGQFLRVSFELSAPPSVSRLFLHCPEEREMGSFDTVVAAHDDAVLFRLEIDFEGLCPLALYAVDYFVYTAGAHPSGGPELSLLPRTYPTNDEFYAAPEDSWVRTSPSRMRDAQSIGLLRTGKRGFVVAELRPYPSIADDEHDEPLAAELFMLRSNGESPKAAGEWEVKLLTARGGKAKRGDICWWQTHKVVPFGTYLCWVDLYRGVIFCNVNHEKPDLQYVQLPAEGAPHCSPDLYRTGFPQASRTVCIGNGNEMKFISVIRSNGMLSGASKPGSSFTITIWTLKQSYDVMEWVKDAAIGAHQLWAMEGYDGLLPRIAPQFPLLSMDNPEIIHFVLREKDTFDADTNMYLVTVNIVSNKVLSYEDNEANISEESDDTAAYSLFFNEPFFPSEFPKFLKKPTSM
uniref:DUF1618 domain-containing protein n=1 Tax=Oryza meridionalis TaxID=40149 RepID=A0A0E0F319_9ORYZ